MRAAYAALEPTLPAQTTVTFEFSITLMPPVCQGRRPRCHRPCVVLIPGEGRLPRPGPPPLSAVVSWLPGRAEKRPERIGMDFGLHIADFTFAGGPSQLGPALAAHVRNAEGSGIRRITVMDHFWQLPGIGPEDHEMLEAYATLGFLVAHTDKVLLHTLVSGVIYREPALLAKQVTTLDVLSG